MPKPTVIKVRFELVGTKMVLLYGPSGKQLRSLDGVIAAWRCYREMVAACRPGERIVATWVGMEGPAAD